MSTTSAAANRLISTEQMTMPETSRLRIFSLWDGCSVAYAMTIACYIDSINKLCMVAAVRLKNIGQIQRRNVHTHTFILSLCVKF